MNLWTIVLLGILAQTSNGCYEISNEKLGEEINNGLNAALTNLPNNPLPAVQISTLQVVPRITEVTFMKTASVHLGDNKWSINCSATLTVGSNSFTNLRLKADIYGELEVGLKNDNMNLKIAGNLSVNLTAETPVTGTTSLTLALGGTYMEMCKQQIQATIQHTCESAVQMLNWNFQVFTRQFSVWGSTCWYKVTKLVFGFKSVFANVDMVRKTAEGVTSTPLYVPQLTTSGLQQGWAWSFYFGETWFSSALNAVPFGYWKSLTPEEFGAYQIFPGFVGKIMVSLKLGGQFNCKITPAESKATAEIDVNISDEAENPLVKLKVAVSINVGISGNQGFFGVAPSGFTNISISLEYVDSRCSCNGDPTANIKSLIDNCLNEAMGSWKCQVQQPLPVPAPLPGLPDNVSCSNGNAMAQCGA